VRQTAWPQNGNEMATAAAPRAVAPAAVWGSTPTSRTIRATFSARSAWAGGGRSRQRLRHAATLTQEASAITSAVIPALSS